MNKEKLQYLLEQQVAKFEGRIKINLINAFCVVADRICNYCPFPYNYKVPPYQRCIRGAVLAGKTDKESAITMGGQYTPVRAKLWANWYRAWLAHPELKPPPLDWREDRMHLNEVLTLRKGDIITCACVGCGCDPDKEVEVDVYIGDGGTISWYHSGNIQPFARHRHQFRILPELGNGVKNYRIKLIRRAKTEED